MNAYSTILAADAICDLNLSGYSLGVDGFTHPVCGAIAMRPRLTVRRVQEIVADFYGISIEFLTGPSKQSRHVQPRHVAILIAREVCQRSTPDLGMRFGKRDHTTILNALSRVRERMRNDPELVEDVEYLKAKVRG